MILKYWNNKFDKEWQLKYLLNNKLTKYPKSNEDKNEPKNIGYYLINKKTSLQRKMWNVRSKGITSRSDRGW